MLTTESAPNVPALTSARGRVLVADDEDVLSRAYARILSAAGFDVECAPDGLTAIELMKTRPFDVIVSDINMPGMDGMELLRRARQHDLDVAVVLVTGTPAVDTAIEAVQYGALRYLVKPVNFDDLRRVVGDAVKLHRLAEMKRRALTLLGDADKQLGDRAGLESRFRRGMEAMWMAVQPILSVPSGAVFGYEALLRTTEPTLPHPGAFLDAAERLGKIFDLGQAIRAQIAQLAEAAPPEAVFFVNLHPRDLLDETLYARDAPLTRFASRVVLEITERDSLDALKDVRARVARLKALGYRIAVDDLGAGYAGLTSFALLEPQVVKLDMTLVRDVHRERIKRELILSMTSLCRELGMTVVAEGVETVEERDALVALGCDLLQGYLFARPGRAFPAATW